MPSRGGRNGEAMGSVSGVGRVAALGAVIAAVVLVALVLFGRGGDGYTSPPSSSTPASWSRATRCRPAARRSARSSDIKITDDGQAEVKLNDQGEVRARCRSGTRAAIRQFSQSGIANRYVDLSYPDRKVGDAGRRRHDLDVDRTTHRGRPRPALQHARPAHPQGAAGLLQGPGAPVPRRRHRGQRGLPVPEPGAVHLQPAVQRAHRATSRRSSASWWTAPSW